MRMSKIRFVFIMFALAMFSVAGGCTVRFFTQVHWVIALILIVLGIVCYVCGIDYWINGEE